MLPCEAAIISSINGTDRYLKISVATEPTDKDNAFLYTYSGWVAWPEEQSEYYDGYDHYYDLKENKYFEDWDEADLSELHGVYQRESIDDGKTAIVTPDGTVLTELDFWPYEIYGEAELFSKSQDDGYMVVARTGDPISEIRFKGSPLEKNGYLYAVNVEDEQAKTVIDFDGKIYADGSDEIWNVIEQPYGFNLLYNRDNKSLLLYPDGTVAELGEYDNGGDMPFYRWHSDKEPDKFFVLNKGQYQDLSEESLVNSGTDSYLMVKTKSDGESEYSLYNTIDGSLILEKGGTAIYASDFWVYALKDGTWDVYKVVVNN